MIAATECPSCGAKAVRPSTTSPSGLMLAAGRDAEACSECGWARVWTREVVAP